MELYTWTDLWMGLLLGIALTLIAQDMIKEIKIEIKRGKWRR
jgi:hypothetical protein